MNVTLKPEQERFVQAQLTTGRYATVDEVIGEAFKLLEEREQQHQSSSLADDFEKLRKLCAEENYVLEVSSRRDRQNPFDDSFYDSAM